VTEIRIKTSRRTEAVNITAAVEQRASGTTGSLLHVYTPHTTCAITISEDADPDVMKDVLDGLDRLAPRDHGYRHREGNSDAHIKSTLVGCSVTVPLVNGRLQLGTWQGIFLMEFDGPRERKVFVSIAE
jgi:secondary thiamine-phosphate synthase enzyme